MHSAQLIDGRALADDILADVKKTIDASHTTPGLAAVVVGEDPASLLYVRNKKRAAQKVGIDFHEYRCDDDMTETDLLGVIDWLNQDPTINAIIVQLPLPEKFDAKKIIQRISPAKDVDGFHPKNRLPFLSQRQHITSPLIQAIQVSLSATKEDLKNKHCLIISKNPIFSQPLETALKKTGLKIATIGPDDATLKQKANAADVLISVVGQEHCITADMVKADAIVIDVGTTMRPDKTWAGDVDPAVKLVAGWLTPVPGGIGPLTVAMLIKNTLALAEK